MSRRYLPPILLAPLLTSCMSLPGSETEPSLHFDLPSPSANCSAGGTPLALTVAEVSPGLDSDRIARRAAATGEFTYLQDVRWVGRSAVVVEKALARDLECRGYTVLSGPQRRGSHDQLVCELRAFNLIDSGGRNAAEVGLSCLVFRQGAEDIAVVARGRSNVGTWSATSAVNALSDAYRQAVEKLLEPLPRQHAPDE